VRIGAHVSISGGIWRAVERIVSIGGNTLQIFSGSPRSWTRPSIVSRDKKKFRKLCVEKDVSPVFVHAKYLISLGNKKTRVQKSSIRSLIDDLGLCKEIGGFGVIFHPNGEDKDLLIENIKTVLAKTPSGVFLIVENTAWSSLESLSWIFKKVNSSNLKLCLDTAHAFEAGYNIKKKQAFDLFIQELENRIGLNKLAVIHANDSKTVLGSHHDKHQDIGERELGFEPFRFLLKEDRICDLPFILETPGFKNKGEISDSENINRLKRLVKNT